MPEKITSTALVLLVVLVVACSDSPLSAPISDGDPAAQEVTEWLRLLAELRVVDPIAAELLNLARNDRVPPSCST